MAKVLTLTVTLSTQDGDPGHPHRFVDTLRKIGTMISDGATAGEFRQEYTYSQGGEATREFATITYSIVRE